MRVKDQKDSTAKEFIENSFLEREEFARDVRDGFDSALKTLPPRWLYDDHGSHLFSKITRVPEYYPTAREAEIFRVQGEAIAKTMGHHSWKVVEFGAGDGRKTEILLRAMMGASEHIDYTPIDVSSAALEELGARLDQRLPQVRYEPFVGENFNGLAELVQNRTRDRGDYGLCVLFLGSSIGNCERGEVDRLLRRLRESLEPGDTTVIGFDLVKDSARLVRAYSDQAGVTSEFNLNLLRRMNRELNANFELDWFRHEATWNPAICGMESWLVSLRDQVVTIGALERSYKLRQWEPIRTEVSLKFQPDDLAGLAERHGFQQLGRFEDSAGDFTDAVWMASPQILS